MDAQLRIENVSKYYGSVAALHRVSLEVPVGSFLTLLGPSGSGKTTLLRILAGFERSPEGRILLNGAEITALEPERRNFGMVFQGYALFPHMSVFGNVAYPLKVRGLGRAEIGVKVKQALEMVQLAPLAQRRPYQLSGGQQQRVALARAMVFDPDLLLLDEPMSALDRKLRAELHIELRRLHQQLGKTFVYVTHDQDEAMAMSDVVAIMNKGEIIQIAAPDDLYNRPRTRFVAEFLGRSNFIEGEVLGGCAEGGLRYRTGGKHILRHRDPSSTVSANTRITLMLRPERIAIRPPGEGGPEEGGLPGVVDGFIYFGDRRLYQIRTEANGVMLAYLGAHGEFLPKPGERVVLSWTPTDTWPVTVPQEPSPGTAA